jgi:hypothetical protein
MRKRGIRVQVWLNKEEKTKLQTSAKKAGLSQETYLRALINGYVPKQIPSPDYYAMMKELHAIGTNLNQIAARANAIGHIDCTTFQYEENKKSNCYLIIHHATYQYHKLVQDNLSYWMVYSCAQRYRCMSCKIILEV